MRKYSIFISIITLIFGFSFYGESVNLSLLDTEYVIAAEVLCFGFWLIATIIIQMISLKRYFSRDEA
tara:strand:+ start:409 stop:609 length:201 start_codon:yes stop_codon:yes gene_type:complete